MPNKFELGKYKIDYGGSNINNCIFHIRGVVDEYYVCRRWVKKRWHYSVESEYFLELLEKNGTLTQCKK